MDTVTRGLAQKLGDALGQSFVVDNRPGAGSQISLEILAAAAPDGHTLMMLSATTVVHPILYKSRFDIVRDFAPVSQVSAQGYVLGVHPSVPARTMKELAQLAKQHPGQLTFASTSAGPQLMGELFRLTTGTNMVHVPYKGAGPAMIDAIGGQVQLTFGPMVSTLPYVRNGQLRALGVTSAQRSPVAPEIPTLAQSGVAGYEVLNWYGIVAPASTAKPIIDRLNREIVAILMHVQTLLLVVGMFSALMSFGLTNRRDG